MSAASCLCEFVAMKKFDDDDDDEEPGHQVQLLVGMLGKHGIFPYKNQHQ